MNKALVLTGKKQICNFLGRGWRTVERWIIEKGFPAKKIDGIWESDSELITAWRRRQINGAETPPEAASKKAVKSKR